MADSRTFFKIYMTGNYTLIMFNNKYHGYTYAIFFYGFMKFLTR